MRKFAHYIEHTHFTVETDHQALRWLHALKDSVGHLARWALRLQELNFTVRYHLGCTNLAADALSGNPINVVNEETPIEVKTAMAVEDDAQYPSREQYI